MSEILQINDVIPVGTILLFNNVDGTRTAYFEGEALPTDLTPAQELAKAIQQGALNIERSAGAARARYITVSAGMDAVYMLKKEEAMAYKAASYPVGVSSYPMIVSEMSATGATGKVAADTILAKAAMWTQLAASIEDLRGSAKRDLKDVTLAVDVPAVESIVDSALTALDAI